MAEEKINWSGKTKRDLETYFSTDTKKGLSRKNYAAAIEKYGENIIDPDTLKNRNFYGMDKKKFDMRAVFSRSAGISGVIYILSAVIIDLLGFDIKLFLVFAYIFLIVSSFIIFMLSEYNYFNLYRITRPRILVTRHGKKEKVFAESIVPGDLITLAKGDIVPADAKIIKSNNLSCSHKFRTADGEHNLKPYKTHSVGRDGSRAYGFEADILYASDIIESGNCTAVVFATGRNILIAEKYKGEDKPVPKITEKSEAAPGIQANAARISKSFFLLTAAFAVTAILYGIFTHRDLTLVILTCLTASASAFSEQLTIIADYALTYGMKKSALFGAVIKKTEDIDRLNNINMIIAKKNDFCSDDRLKLDKIYFTDEDFEVSYENKYDIGYIILNAAAVCDYYNPAVARAVFEAADRLELNYRENKKLGEVNNNGKITSAPVLNNKNIVLVCLGEAENIIKKCASQLTGGELFEPVNIPALERRLLELYEKHDLVMAVALKELTSVAGDLNTVPEDLDFWIFAAFSEVNIPEVRENMESLKNFGVMPVMIAESNGGYTYKTALKFGIVRGSDDYPGVVVTNNNIDNNINLNKLRIIERLSEKNYIKLLRNLKSRGKYAAVTAGNVSEAEILNESYLAFCPANIKDEVLKNKSGVNMKNMSLGLVLKAVRNADLIYRNIMNAMIFSAGLFSAQYMLIFFALIFNGAYILNPAQIIWSSAGAGFFCAFAVALNSEDLSGIKKRKALKNDGQYFKIMIKRSAATGLNIFISVILTFFICYAMQGNILDYIGTHENIITVQTAAFFAYILACFANSARYIKNFLKNKIFMAALAINIILIYIALSVEPVREYLEFGIIDLKNICAAAAVGTAQIILFMFAKNKVNQEIKNADYSGNSDGSGRRRNSSN